MQSESARMTTREEARYRIPYPNSKKRDAKIVALDKPSVAIVNALAKKSWNGAQFFSFAPPGDADKVGQATLKTWLHDLAGHTLDLVEEIAHSDFVVVVTCAGEDARAVSAISELCELHHKTLIALVVPTEDDNEAAVAESLRHLRPHARMLVVTHGQDYVENMLIALRA